MRHIVSHSIININEFPPAARIYDLSSLISRSAFVYIYLPE